jgi:integrase
VAHGDGTVYLRGKVWYIRYWRDNQPVTISCPGLTEAQARTKLKHEQRKSDDNYLGPREKRTTIAELVKDLRADYESRGRADLSTYTERRWKLHLEEPFGKMRAHEFGTTQQREYRVKRTKAGATVATINRELQVIRNAFTVGFDHDPPKVKRVPKFTFVKEENARQGFVTIQQMQALKEAASQFGLEYRVIVELGCWLGWRRGELLNLRVGNVRFDGGPHGCIRLDANETKNGDAREVPLTRELRVMLEPFVIARKPQERLFTTKSIRWTWPKITEAAGVPDLLFHDLRRSVARTRRSAGVDTSVIMAMQGWRTDSMFRRYAIVATNDKLDAMALQQAYESKLLAPPTIEGAPQPSTKNKEATVTKP